MSLQLRGASYWATLNQHSSGEQQLQSGYQANGFVAIGASRYGVFDIDDLLIME
jgi:hypothetical protein